MKKEKFTPEFKYWLWWNRLNENEQENYIKYLYDNNIEVV